MKPSTHLVLFAALNVVISAAAADNPPPASVTLISSNKVAATFAKGGPLLENRSYKVQAGRREGAGIAELHDHDTDIFHFLEGSATFVTGGTPVELQDVGPGEHRAKELRGGETRRVGKGDVIIIPKGVPHWFKEVNGPLLYYVVKVTDPEKTK